MHVDIASHVLASGTRKNQRRFNSCRGRVARPQRAQAKMGNGKDVLRLINDSRRYIHCDKQRNATSDAFAVELKSDAYGAYQTMGAMTGEGRALQWDVANAEMHVTRNDDDLIFVFI